MAACSGSSVIAESINKLQTCALEDTRILCAISVGIHNAQLADIIHIESAILHVTKPLSAITNWHFLC